MVIGRLLTSDYWLYTVSLLVVEVECMLALEVLLLVAEAIGEIGKRVEVVPGQ